MVLYNNLMKGISLMPRTKAFFLHVIATVLLPIFLFSDLTPEEKRLKLYPEGKTHNEILSIVKKEKGKFGMLYFTTDWCGPCKLLEKKTFRNIRFIKYTNAHFIPFRINAEKQTGPELKKKYNIRAYPTAVFINDKDEVIEKVIGYKPPNAYLVILGNIVNGKKTLLSMKRLYEKDPNNEDVAIQYARNLFTYNEFKTAKSIYEKYLRIAKSKENLSEIYFNLATIYKEEGKAEKTALLLEEGLEKYYFVERKEHVHYMLADFYFKNEQYAQAIDNYNLISKDTKYYSTAQITMAISYFKTGSEKEGSKLLDKLFSEAADDISKLYTLSWICLHMKVYMDKAVKWNRKAVELTNWEKDYLVNNYALLLFETEKRGEAIKAIRRAIEIATDESSKNVSKRNLAIMYWRNGNPKVADELFTELFEEAKNDPNKLNDLAWSCREYKVNLRNALGWAKRAVELSEEKVDYILNTYANLLFDNGNFKDALEIQKKALEITTSESRKEEYKKNINRYKNALDEKINKMSL